MIALYRPGPMKNIPDYIARKHGKQKVTYIHPKMEAFLGDSYGILVYQEDIMMTALTLAGYNWGTVDKLRKAIGKKIPAEMAKQHKIFVDGCIKEAGLSKKEAETIWDLFEPFQGYGFNKAHAASYGRVAYQTAYLKAHYPALYMSAVLTADAGDTEKISEMIAECKRMNIKILPPDVQKSGPDFRVEKIGDEDAIRFGLETIKNFGHNVAEAVVTDRKKNGEYLHLEDFCVRIGKHGLNRKGLESLAMCGALDSFGVDRGNADNLLALSREQQASNHDSLFGLIQRDSSLPELTLVDAEPAVTLEKLAWEKELLGVYVSGHPLQEVKGAVDSNIQKIKLHGRPKSKLIFYAVVDNVRSLLTKKGDKMMFMQVSDTHDAIEVVVFPDVLTKVETCCVPGQTLKIEGEVNHRNDVVSILATRMRVLEDKDNARKSERELKKNFTYPEESVSS